LYLNIPDWCEYYDTNGIDGIQKDEAVDAINDYLIHQSIIEGKIEKIQDTDLLETYITI